MSYEASPQVRRLLKQENIDDEEFQQMVKLSAPYHGNKTVSAGMNRRFHGWLFKVLQSDVFDMRKEV